MDLSGRNKSSSFSHMEFILFGFPGVTEFRPLLALPFSSIYAVILGGNSVVTLLIVLEKSLHTPMYTLIFSLLAVNVVYTTAITPKMLLALFGLDQITLAGCLVQMFVVYSSIMAESTIVLLMAVDRYLAIIQPLHYHEIVGKQLVVHLAVNGVIRNGVFVFPLVIYAARLSYCRSNVIHHFHCESMMLFSLGCGESRAQIIGLVVRTLTMFCDITIIFISYLKVLHTVLRIAAGTARYKALHTCSTHLVVVVLINAFGCIISILHLLGNSASYNLQNICSAIYFLFPAMVNPFIYGVRMEEIKSNLQRRWRKKTHNSIRDRRH
ncbi:PREDICTED: olfactory receptor 51E2-like [Nanorana parkeri]|uniref:olfactory receptor 51E2-like n=1 Tax=Nanorana parkeri TaxID=125878 RepID=UPI000854029B|nr:PREDICTED: olfactory receptor 51E2-like [Nanorana parkeri]